MSFKETGEIKSISTRYSVPLSAIAEAVDYMLSERTLQRLVSGRRKRVSELQQIVLTDILQGLRLGVVRKTFENMGLAKFPGTLTAQKHIARRRWLVKVMKELITDARRIP